MSVFVDSFNRADQLGLGTSSQGTWSWSAGIIDAGFTDIVSNQAKQRSGTLTAIYRAEVDLASTDHYAQVLVIDRGTNANSDVGVCCRLGAAAFYFARINQNGVALFRYSSFSYTQLGSTTTVTVSLPQTLRCSVVGTTIKAYWNGVEVVSATDATITTGLRGGIRLGGSSGGTQCIADSFQTGDLPEPPAGAGLPVFVINT